jgi:hypothetical protein
LKVRKVTHPDPAGASNGTSGENGGGRSQGELVSAFLEYREFTGKFLKTGPENSGPVRDFPARDGRFFISDQISEQGIFLLLAGSLRSVSGFFVNERLPL